MKMNIELQRSNYSWATDATQWFVRQPAATLITFVRIRRPAFTGAYETFVRILASLGHARDQIRPDAGPAYYESIRGSGRSLVPRVSAR